MFEKNGISIMALIFHQCVIYCSVLTKILIQFFIPYKNNQIRDFTYPNMFLVHKKHVLVVANSISSHI